MVEKHTKLENGEWLPRVEWETCSRSVFVCVLGVGCIKHAILKMP